VPVCRVTFFGKQHMELQDHVSHPYIDKLSASCACMLWDFHREAAHGATRPHTVSYIYINKLSASCACMPWDFHREAAHGAMRPRKSSLFSQIICISCLYATRHSSGNSIWSYKTTYSKLYLYWQIICILRLYAVRLSPGSSTWSYKTTYSYKLSLILTRVALTSI
jgi:hypothetical protein